MRRVIKTLNEMSFELPEGWEIVSDKYKLSNGQGFINSENYLSKSGKVISLFEIFREPNEFFEYYQRLVEGYNKKTDMYELEKQFTLKLGEFEFPTYIVKGFKDNVIHVLHSFVNCGDRLGCFIVTLDKVSDDPKDIIKENEAFSALVKILRTVQ